MHFWISGSRSCCTWSHVELRHEYGPLYKFLIPILWVIGFLWIPYSSIYRPFLYMKIASFWWYDFYLLVLKTIYRVYRKKGNRTSTRYCIWITLRMNEIFHLRKDQAFSCWMTCSSCQMDKKWANTNPIKNVSQNRIFSPLRVGSKTIENEPLLVLKLMNFTSINDAHIHSYY